MAMIVQLQEGVVIKKFEIENPILRIGRDPDSDICIDDDVISTEHAVIEVKKSSEPKGSTEYYIRDLGSTNSTFVNDKKISSKKLAHNDIIRVGWNNFKFIEETKKDLGKTSKIHKSWIPGVYYTKD
jgi:pSer/pThr/pTyr-binding forkhead associated (FHA) protein